jgi:hypothetical protein
LQTFHKKGYKEIKGIFLFNETLIYKSLQSFYLNNKPPKIQWCASQAPKHLY